MIGQVGFLTERIFVAVILALSCLAVTIVVGAYLVREARVNPTWYLNWGNKGAVAIFIFMLGETVARGWGAALIIAYRQGFDLAALENQYPLAFVGAVIAYIGAVCKLRIFSPGWADWIWVSMALAIIVLGAIAAAV